MTKLLVLLVGLALGGVAQAQIKCWTTADGKRACGDAPPPGAKVTTVKVPSGSAAPAPGAESKDSKKGPMTAAEKEQDYRKRQAELQKAAAKAEEKQKEDDVKKENCRNAKENLSALEGGQRIQRTDAKGERYYVEDAQREQETAKARAQVQQSCS